MKIEEIIFGETEKLPDLVLLGPEDEEELDSFDLNRELLNKMLDGLFEKGKKEIPNLQLIKSCFHVRPEDMLVFIKLLKANSVFVSSNDEDVAFARSNGAIPMPIDMGPK